MACDEAFCAFAARSLLERVQALTRDIGGVREARDIECVHRMRVASRRFRSALSLFECCFPPKRYRAWRRGTKAITRVLGEARDLDVQIAFIRDYIKGKQERRLAVGPRRLRLRLIQKREEVQVPVLKALEDFERSGIANEMAVRFRAELGRWKLTGHDFRTAGVLARSGENIRSCMEEVLGFEECLGPVGNKEELHAMRIANKRLRYVMEVFAPLYEDGLKEEIRRVRTFHSRLGKIHDCDVWDDFLALFLEEERRLTLAFFGHTRSFPRLVAGIEVLAEDRRCCRRELYSDFRDLYHRTRSEGFWGKLSHRLDAGKKKADPKEGPCDISSGEKSR